MTDNLKAITLGLVILGIWFHSLWIRGGRQ